MSKKCPKCGSGYFEVREDDTCLSCGWHRVTVFNRITASPEVLAEKLVYCGVYYKSTIIPGESWEYKQEAIAATVARLKEVCNG